jgi:hypothetical protein
MRPVTFGRVSVLLPAENYVAGSTTPKGITISPEQDLIKASTPMPQILDRTVRHRYCRPQIGSIANIVRVLPRIHGFNVSYRDSMQAAARLVWGLR